MQVLISKASKNIFERKLIVISHPAESYNVNFGFRS